MTRIEREKKVMRQMVEIYCRRHHEKGGTLCEECRRLLEYSQKRIEHCPKGDRKTSCRKCEIHCYSPDYKERVRMVMRYVGPRMIFIHPIAAVRHLIGEMRKMKNEK